MKTKIALIIACITVALFGRHGFVVEAGLDLSGCTQQTFRITAYYSPKAEQRYFFKGDYDAEVTLNGRGTHGASGAPVFNGMVAAPQSYAFGTQIIFPGYGIGEVEDRGWAIVQKGEKWEAYDRIDIWLGEGEEGLKRAISFGVKYLDGYICPERTSKKVGRDLKAFPIDQNFFFNSLWIIQLAEGRNDPRVWMLQRMLAYADYLPSDDLSSAYDEKTTDAVCAFQHDYLGLPKNSEFCGYFGPQTRSALLKAMKKLGVYDTFIAKDSDEIALAGHEAANNETTPLPDAEQAVEEEQIDLPEIEWVDSKSTDVDNTDASPTDPQIAQKNAHYLAIGDTRAYQFLENIAFGEHGREIKMLQRKLQWLGYMPQPISGIYDQDTADAVYALQKEYGLVKASDDPRIFGFFGPKTREKINSL